MCFMFHVLDLKLDIVVIFNIGGLPLANQMAHGFFIFLCFYVTGYLLYGSTILLHYVNFINRK